MELLVSNATRKGTFKTTVPWRKRQAKAPETKKIRLLPDMTLLLYGGTRDPNVEILILK